jgi:hypothetical protein
VSCCPEWEDQEQERALARATGCYVGVAVLRRSGAGDDPPFRFVEQIKVELRQGDLPAGLVTPQVVGQIYERERQRIYP